MCYYFDSDDCHFTYVYTYDQSGKVIIRAQEERECPPQVYFMGNYLIKYSSIYKNIFLLIY